MGLTLGNQSRPQPGAGLIGLERPPHFAGLPSIGPPIGSDVTPRQGLEYDRRIGVTGINGRAQARVDLAEVPLLNFEQIAFEASRFRFTTQLFALFDVSFGLGVVAQASCGSSGEEPTGRVGWSKLFVVGEMGCRRCQVSCLDRPFRCRPLAMGPVPLPPQVHRPDRHGEANDNPDQHDLPASGPDFRRTERHSDLSFGGIRHGITTRGYASARPFRP